ncbi:hypothetical protein AK812_SmicGene48415, partial [Symbiodinium microadriaticum]
MNSCSWCKAAASDALQDPDCPPWLWALVLSLSLYKIDDKVRSDDSTQSVAQDEEALWQAQTTTCWTAGDSRFSDGATRPASRASAVPEIAKEGPSVRVSL